MMRSVQRFGQHFWIALSLAIIPALLIGCESSGPERISVSGEVHWNGEPLSTGMVTFIPLEKGTAASGEIKDGNFVIEQKVGPSPGPCRVEVLSYQKTGRMIAGMAPGTQEAEIKQVIPAKFNVRTQLEEKLIEDKSIRIELSPR